MFTEEQVKAYLAQNVTRNVKKDDPKDIRVMSSNVLFAKAEEVPEWLPDEDRALILTEYYLHYKPDFLGLQEMEPKIHAMIMERLQGEYAIPETDYEGACIMTPSLYRKEAWTPLKTGFHRFLRQWCWQYHWALYQSKADPNVKVIHMNFHYHPGKLPWVDVRCHAVVDMNTELLRLRKEYPDVPIFLSGDYNVNVDSPEYAGTFCQGVNMRSGMLLTEDNDGYMCACHALGKPSEMKWKAIDHISVTEELVTVKRHRIIHDDMVIFGSDHCPIFIDTSLK